MMCRSRWAAQRICVVLVALALWSATPLAQQVFTGKVVGITDGDTISVMRAGLAVRVRLEGIDCPENAQDFSNRAKQFTSAKAFGKTVTIEPRDVDRYGRLVARVVVDGKDVSLGARHGRLSVALQAVFRGSRTGEGGGAGKSRASGAVEPPDPYSAVGVPAAGACRGCVECHSNGRSLPRQPAEQSLPSTGLLELRLQELHGHVQDHAGGDCGRVPAGGRLLALTIALPGSPTRDENV